MGAPGGEREEEGDPVPMRGSRVSARGPGRQQARDPEPSRPPGSEIRPRGSGRVDSQQGRSLVLVTTWFPVYTSGSPALSPGELLGGVAGVRVELAMAKLPLLLFLQEAGDVPLLQPRQERPPLSQEGSVFCVWKLCVQPSLSESILKELNCLRFHFIHDISKEVLESKAFIHVFMADICGNTALVKGKTFSIYIPHSIFFP